MLGHTGVSHHLPSLGLSPLPALSSTHPKDMGHMPPHCPPQIQSLWLPQSLRALHTSHLCGLLPACFPNWIVSFLDSHTTLRIWFSPPGGYISSSVKEMAEWGEKEIKWVWDTTGLNTCFNKQMMDCISQAKKPESLEGYGPLSGSAETHRHQPCSVVRRSSRPGRSHGARWPSGP